MHLLYPEGTEYQTWLPQTYLSLVLKIHLQIRQIHTIHVYFTYVYENESISNNHVFCKQQQCKKFNFEILFDAKFPLIKPRFLYETAVLGSKNKK